MKLATLKRGGVAAVIDGDLRPLARAGFDGDLVDLAELGLAEARRIVDELGSGGSGGSDGGEPYDPSRLSAPILRPSKIVAIGLNYLDHAAETELELPAEPLVFTKFPSALTGPTDPIRIPEGLTREVDFEAELGVVIGRRARNVAAERALTHVFGYTVLNDVSARDLQFRDGQWVRGKSLDGFCPCGPVVASRDEVPDPQALEIGCELDGAVMQRAGTGDMIFGVAALIERLSAWFTLEPGDLVATGTPSGVGFTRTPPVYLRPGARLRTWVGGIGELDNPVERA